MLHFYFQI